MLQSLIVIINKEMRFASKLLIICVPFLQPIKVMAQGCPNPPCPPPCPDGSFPPCGPQPGLPIDDYVPLLLVLGLVYGSYRLIKIIKKHQDRKS